MAIFARKKHPTAEGAEIAREASKGGGWFANVTAMLALLFSSYSFYETVLRADALRLFVPPTIEFSDPSNGPFDVYVVPVTIANLGARAGVALTFDLDVTNPRTGDTKRYYAAGFGSWRQAVQGNREPFAPLSVAGRESASRRILFWPRDGETIDRHVEVEGGTYRFRLTMTRVTAATLPEPLEKPDTTPVVLEFEMEIDGLDYRRFSDGGTMLFRRADYAPVVSQ